MDNAKGLMPCEALLPSFVGSGGRYSLTCHKSANARFGDGTAVLSALIILSTLSSTFIGAKFLGISVPVALQLPFIIYVTVKYGASLRIPYKQSLFWFVCLGLFSYLYSLLLSYADLTGYVSDHITYCVEYTICIIPLIVCYSNIPDGRDRLRWGIVWACRLECIWGILQLLLYTIAGVNISQVVFGDLLHLTNTNDWLTTYNAGDATHIRTELRLTGTTSDGAFLGLFLVVGLVLDRSLLMRVVYIMAAMLSVQRATVVCMVVVIAVYIYRRIKASLSEQKKRSHLRVRNIAIVLAISVIIILFLYRYSDIVVSRLGLMLARFNTSGTDGTYRHVMYIPWVLQALISTNPFVALFGVGLRSSGVLLSDPDGPFWQYLNAYMQSGRSWSIESDIACVFGGCGLVRGLVYLYMFGMFFSRCSNDYRVLMLAVFCFAFMYDFSSLIVGYLIYTLLMLDSMRNSGYKIRYEGVASV